MPPRLILNADDFGLTPGVNRAIAELHQAGVLTSASLMATGAAFDEAVSLAHKNPGLGIGCHLVFVDGDALSPPTTIPSLLPTNGSHFYATPLAFASALWRGAIRPKHIECEARAQIQALQRAGLHVTHVDTHKHLHSLPAVLKPILAAAHACGVHALRRPFEPRWSSAQAHPTLTRRLQLIALTRFQPQFDALTPDFCKPAGTLGIAATGSLDAATLRATLSALTRQPDDPTCELCCHPGHLDATLSQITTRLRESREQEYAALKDVVPAFLGRNSAPQQLRLIHYGDLSPTTGSAKAL
jgi:predicted glycoside hydrolase/deacetylase ChbG (UPF0249 family)